MWVLWWLFGFICDLLHRQIFVQQAICEQLQKEWNRSEVHLSVKIIIYLCTNWLNIYYFLICLSEKGVRICSFRVFLNCHERFLFYRLVICHFSATKYFCLPKKQLYYGDIIHTRNWTCFPNNWINYESDVRQNVSFLFENIYIFGVRFLLKYGENNNKRVVFTETNLESKNDENASSLNNIVKYF